MTYPAAVDYRVFVGHYSTDSHLLGVYCLRQSDGAILWKRESSVSTPIDSLTVAVADGEVYWFDNRPNPRVECLDEFSGNVLWSVSIPELLSSVPAAFAYNKFYLSSEDGYLYALDNGVLSWKRYVGFASYGKSASPPAVADEKVFVSTNSSIIGLDANTGDVIWTYSVSEANPPIVADGYIVFSQSNAIYAIRSDAPPTIPEFPAWTPMLLMFIVLLAIIAIHNRKPSKTQIQANTKNQELF
jgi:outer membrane protein assembly factor BamB